MAKKASPFLVELIETMTKSEKRYFRLYARNFPNESREEDSIPKYIYLFNLIETGEAKEDFFLSKKIYEKHPKAAEKFTVLKSYLYEVILNCLQNYDLKDEVEMDLRNKLQNVQVLYKRGLYEQCKHLLKKIQKIAAKFNLESYLIEVNKWLRKIAEDQQDYTFYFKKLSSINDEIVGMLNKLEKQETITNLYYRLLIQAQKGLSRQDQDVMIIQVIEKEVDELTKNLTDSPTGIMYVFRSKIMLAYIKQNWKEYAKESSALLAHFKLHFYLTKIYTNHYLKTYQTLILAHGFNQNYDGLLETLDRLKNIKTNSIPLKSIQITNYYLYYLTLMNIKGEYEEAVQLIEREILRPSIYNKLNTKNEFQYHFAHAYFGIKNYNKALEHLEKYAHYAQTEARKDLQSVARFFIIIIHLEMNNSILLESLLRSYNRFLITRNNRFEFEKLMIRFSKKYIKLARPKEQLSSIKKLRDDFNKLITEYPEEKMILLFFHFQAWLDSKINKEDFPKAVHEYFRKNSP